MAKRGKVSGKQRGIVAALVIACIGIGLWVTEDYWRPAALAPYKESYDVTLSFSDERSGESVSVKAQLKGAGYAVTKTGDSSLFTGVPRGNYTVKAENTSYYTETFTLSGDLAIESRETKELSRTFTMDNIGTFSWGETVATIAMTASDNNEFVFRTHLVNSVKDTVIKSVRHKLVITMTTAQTAATTITDIDCDSHDLEEDDETAMKWVIAGATIGDIAGNNIVTAVWRMKIECENSDAGFTATFGVQDLDGVSPEVSASKAVAATSS